MKAFKRKSLDISNLPALRAVLEDRGQHDIYETLAGRQTDTSMHNVTGCRVNLECVLVQTHKGSPFRLMVKVGGRWKPIDSHIPAASPMVDAARNGGHLIEHGPSRSQLETQEKHAADQQRVNEIQEAEHRRQRAAALALRTEREAHERQRRAELAASR